VVITDVAITDVVITDVVITDVIITDIAITDVVITDVAITDIAITDVVITDVVNAGTVITGIVGPRRRPSPSRGIQALGDLPGTHTRNGLGVGTAATWRRLLAMSAEGQVRRPPNYGRTWPSAVIGRVCSVPSLPPSAMACSDDSVRDAGR
jgi:hypothetical protein